MTGSFINTPIDERGGNKRTSTVMNRDNLTIQAKLFESVPNRFLSTGTPGLQQPGSMAEIWVALNQLLAASDILFRHNYNYFLHTTSREEPVKGA